MDLLNYSTTSLVELDGLKNFATQYNIAIKDPDLIRRYRMVEYGKRDVATKIVVAEKRAAQKNTAELVVNLMASTGWDEEKAMDSLRVPENEREVVRTMAAKMAKVTEEKLAS